MNHWFAKTAILLGIIVMIAIRAPHGERSRHIKVAQNRKGPLEFFLLTLAWLGFLLPILWVATPLFASADYPLHPAPFSIGILFLAFGLWCFWCAHLDLGTNWSISLELREKHELITKGIYRRVRHPMYLALFLFSVGQALTLPNWLAGPSYLVMFTILFALRVQAEERMMLDQFGKDYESYMERTQRLVPGVW